MTRRPGMLFALIGAFALVIAACGDDDTATGGEGAGSDGSADRPTVVVTTNILGDVVESFAGAHVDVVTIMPVGADPHDFQASAQQANEMREADALIVNGADFEEGLLDVIESATDDGTPTFAATDAVETIAYGEAGHDDHGEEDGDHDDHADEDEDGAHDDHDHDGVDPHFFTAPNQMALAVDGIADFLIETVDGVDSEALRTDADGYIAELEALDDDVEATFADLADEDRVLITNHDVFGYFAARYGFEVVGTVLPGGSTADGASAGALADLAQLIEDEGVPAIFVDNSASTDLADTLADEVGDIAVVELFTGSLGEADSDGATYLAMVQANADRIADALAG